MTENQQQAQIKLRMSVDLKNWFKDRAMKNHRTLTNEINYILDLHYRNEKEDSTDQDETLNL